MVKHRPAMREIQVRSLDQEDPLEKEMVTHSGTLAWKIPWTEGPGRLQSMGLQRVGHKGASKHFLLFLLFKNLFHFPLLSPSLQDENYEPLSISEGHH